MAFRSLISVSSLLITVTCLLWASGAQSFHLPGLDLTANNSSLACSLVDCVKGKCLDSDTFPFYKCECNTGWKSLLNSTAMPCVLPNCSIDLSCSKSSNSVALSPPAGTSNTTGDACSSNNICGNGECIANGSSYNCKCDPGFVNLFNMTNGYCLPKCSLGADCTNLNLPIIGKSSPPPPPPPPPANEGRTSSSQSSEPLIKNEGAKASIPLIQYLLLICLGSIPVLLIM